MVHPTLHLLSSVGTKFLKFWVWLLNEHHKTISSCIICHKKESNASCKYINASGFLNNDLQLFEFFHSFVKMQNTPRFFALYLNTPCMENLFVNWRSLPLIKCKPFAICIKKPFTLYAMEGLLSWAFPNFRAYTFKLSP
jgi:hypothetical protein